MYSFAHIEIPCTNLEKAAQFYSQLFGWKCEQFMGDDYRMIFNPENECIGGISKVDHIPEIRGFYSYVEVPAVDAAVEKAQQLGAMVHHPKTALPGGWGFYAVLLTSDGYPIGVWAKQ